MSEHSVRIERLNQRAHILEAAVRVIARDGLGQVKSKTVAREAGVSAGSVHYYFETLDLLTREAFLYADAVSLRAMADATTDSTCGRDELESRLCAWLKGGDEFQQAWAVWGELWHASRHSEDIRTLLEQMWDEWVALIGAVIERAKRDRSIPASIESAPVARRLTALLESLGQQLTTGLISAGEARWLLQGALVRELDPPPVEERTGGA